MQNVIYSEVNGRVPHARVSTTPTGIWQIGPMIIRWGTDEQKQRWLPGILNADDHWCQGFTEPEAGTDLANLRTTAIRDGDDYVVNGQKIWISTAHLAKWGLFLVRTDPTAIERGAKHEGITALIVDMRDSRASSAGPSATSPATRCSTRSSSPTPASRSPSRLGGEGEGWKVAMGTLGHERVGHRRPDHRWRPTSTPWSTAARAVNPAAPRAIPAIRERIARACTDIEFTRLLNYRALTKILKGEKNWPEVPLAKLQWSHLAQTLAELAVDLLGPAGLLAKGGPDAVDGGTWTRLYSFQRYTSIGAGTTEVQKNIIADRAIKLPGQARVLLRCRSIRTHPASSGWPAGPGGTSPPPNRWTCGSRWPGRRRMTPGARRHWATSRASRSSSASPGSTTTRAPGWPGDWERHRRTPPTRDLADRYRSGWPPRPARPWPRVSWTWPSSSAGRPSPPVGTCPSRPGRTRPRSRSPIPSPSTAWNGRTGSSRPT